MSVIAVLPNMKDCTAEIRFEYLGMLNQVVASNESLKFTYFWLQAGDHPKFEKDLKLDFGFPTLIVVTQKGYGVMYGSFTITEIKRFLTLVSKGKIRQLEELPKGGLKFEKVKKWDGN